MKTAILILLSLTFFLRSADATLTISTETVQRAVVFIYRARTDTDPDKTNPLGTGFLVAMPTLDNKRTYVVLVTARHIVDPEWALCDRANPSVIFIRVNNSQYDPHQASSGVDYVRIPLTASTGKTYSASPNPNR